MNKAHILGAGLKIKSHFKLDENCTIKPANLKTDIITLAEYATSQRDYGMLCTFAETISFEIEITSKKENALTQTAWNYQWMLILLAIYGQCPLYWPFESSFSPKESKELKIRVINYHLSNKIFAKPKPFSSTDLKECSNLWPNFYKLLEEKSFSNAASIAVINFSEPKAAIRIAAIWSAIESLLGFDSELRFRIAVMCSKLLETNTQQRHRKFKEVQKLYDTRSRCVHGTPISHDKQEAGVKDSLTLLRDLLLYYIKRGRLHNSQERDFLFLE